MKKILLMSLLALAPVAWAQNAPLQGISESTDPEKVREVERRAEEIRANQQQGASSGASESSGRGTASSEERRMHRSDMKREHRRESRREHRDKQ